MCTCVSPSVVVLFINSICHNIDQSIFSMFCIWAAAKCPMGKFSYDGMEPCRPCPKGFYQDKEGMKECTQCSEKTTTLEEASFSGDNCTVDGG